MKVQLTLGFCILFSLLLLGSNSSAQDVSKTPARINVLAEKDLSNYIGLKGKATLLLNGHRIVGSGTPCMVRVLFNPNPNSPYTNNTYVDLNWAGHFTFWSRNPLMGFGVAKRTAIPGGVEYKNDFDRVSAVSRGAYCFKSDGSDELPSDIQNKLILTRDAIESITTFHCGTYNTSVHTLYGICRF